MVHTALLSHHWSEILAYTKSYYISYSYICLFYFLALTGLSHTMWYFFVTTSAQTLCSGSENPLKREKLKRTAPDKPQWDCGKSWPTLTGEKNSCGSVHVKLSHVQLQCLKKKKKGFPLHQIQFFHSNPYFELSPKVLSFPILVRFYVLCSSSLSYSMFHIIFFSFF